MSNMNRFRSFIDDDDEDLSLEETRSESATIGSANSSSYLSVSSDQMTAVAQSVFDQRLNHVDQITNDTMDDLIIYLSHALRMLITAGEFVIPIGEACPWIEESLFANLFDADRAERPNHQIAHPSDALRTILMNLLSPEVIHLIFNRILNDVPFGVQDTQAHTIVLSILNISDGNENINYENGDINEDATVYNDDLMNFTPNEIDVNQMVVTESMATETADEMTDNNNPITSADNRTDINNRNEEITEDTEPENQNNLNIDHSQTSPRPEFVINHATSHENVQTNMPVASIPISSTGSSEQAAEIVSMLAGPTDNSAPTAENPAHILATGLDASQLTVPDRKQSSPFNVPAEAVENNPTSSI